MMISMEYPKNKVLFICQPLNYGAKVIGARTIKNYLRQRGFDTVVSSHPYTVILPKEMT